jgi:hypothetical protein
MHRSWTVSRLAFRSQIRQSSSSTRPRLFQFSFRIRHPLSSNLPRWTVLFVGGASLGILPILHNDQNQPNSGDIFSESAFDEQFLDSHEEGRSSWTTIKLTLSRYFLEPVLTIARFVHLCWLFCPVLLTAPLLLVGTDQTNGSSHWLHGWWYNFLTRQMQKAGPTFVKVRTHPSAVAMSQK